MYVYMYVCMYMHAYKEMHPLRDRTLQRCAVLGSSEGRPGTRVGPGASKLVAIWGLPKICNLLRPLIKMIFLLVPYGYIILKIKKNSIRR